MDTTVDSTVIALYHQTEDYYFTSTCPLHRRLNACVSVYFSDEYINEWNLLFIRVGSSHPGDAVAASLELIRTTALPIRMVIHQDKVQALHSTLAGLDFIAAESSTAMVLDLSVFTSTSTMDSHLHINQTHNLNDWSGPVASAFGMPAEGMAHYQARHQVAIDSGKFLYHFILSVQGRTVCSLTLSMCDELARLNDIGTEVDCRGKGYATQLINAALAHAAILGARWCFLEASTQGLPLYRKLGFSPLFDYQAFVRGPLLAPTTSASTGHPGETAVG